MSRGEMLYNDMLQKAERRRLSLLTIGCFLARVVASLAAVNKTVRRACDRLSATVKFSGRAAV